MTLRSAVTNGIFAVLLLCFVFSSCLIGPTAASSSYQKPSFLDIDSSWWNTPRGPQVFFCLTYLEKNVQVDCEFAKTDKIPGPFCEFKQDGRRMGSTYPNNPVHLMPPIETRQRANVTLVLPNICWLTWMPMLDDRVHTYCRVYQGSTWKENSMAFNQRDLLVCSALSIVAHAALLIFMFMVTLPVSLWGFCQHEPRWQSMFGRLPL